METKFVAAVAGLSLSLDWSCALTFLVAFHCMILNNKTAVSVDYILKNIIYIYIYILYVKIYT